MGDKEEVGRLMNVLKLSVGVLGLSHREIERRRGLRPRRVSRVFAGGSELKVEDLVAIVRAIGLQPWEFFELAYPQSSEPPPSEAFQTIRTMLRDLQPEPASAPALTEREIDRRIQESVREALREMGVGK